MDDLQCVLHGPVQIMWSYSRVADCDMVVTRLREKLPTGTRFFGVQERYSDSGKNYYVYRMVLWYYRLRDDPRFSSMGDEWRLPTKDEWRNGLQEVVAELEATGKKDSILGETETKSQWDVKNCGSVKGEEENTVQFVQQFMQMVQLQKAALEGEGEIVFFGRIAFEYYAADGRRWHEEYWSTADGSRYFGDVNRCYE